MKMTFTLAVLLYALCGAAQGPATDDVLTAEKNFAAYSVSHGTKAAFLAYLDSGGVVFEGGKILNGLATWQKKKHAAGVLNWHPIYGFAAASGDLGFTTGPWTFQPRTTADSVVARGQYASVWKKNEKGKWKVLVDLGTTNVPSLDNWMYDSAEKAEPFISGTWNNLLNREQKFVAQTATANLDARRLAYVQATSQRFYFLNRNGNLPATGFDDLRNTMKKMPKAIDYTITGSGISAAGDLGYVYGTTLIAGRPDNYLRIWRREGKEWKLALEVLPY